MGAAWRYVFGLSLVIFFAMASRAAAQDEWLPNVVHPLPANPPAWLDGYKVRWPVRVLGRANLLSGKSVAVSIPSGGWLRPDAADVAVQGPSGKRLDHRILSHNPRGDTLVQFRREGAENWYWVYGNSPDAKTEPKDLGKDPDFQEGVSVEVRECPKDKLAGWADMRVMLDANPPLVAGALVNDVSQVSNPFRPDVPEHFTSSYRGFITVEKDGPHRFFVNSEGACALFIDKFKVFERPGDNRPLGTVKVKELDKLAGVIDLKPGVHEIEVHHAVGVLPNSYGRMWMMWSPPGETKFTIPPPTAFPRPLKARAAAAEFAGKGAFFVFGLDDAIDIAGLQIYLVRFEAQGNVDPKLLVWDMGDGTMRTGRSIVHAYFKEGDYDVSLAGGDRPFTRKIHVWAEPGKLSPLSLELAVETLAAMDWKKLEPGRIREMFTFVNTCEQSNRWPLLDQVAEHLLGQKDLDLETRSQLVAARLESLTRQGKAAEALKFADAARIDFAKTPALLVRVQLGAAAIHQYHFKDFAAAGKIYKAILDENSRIEHPNFRLAAVRWGDMFAEAGDLVRAGETYRLASALGGEKLVGAGSDPSARGATLRIAEQKLKAGEVMQARQLLQRLEIDSPGRRLDGLYCFLRAESDRLTGRYEEALRSYEMILKLPQWAGYKDRAIFGLADTHLRMNDLPRAKEWLAALKEGFPKTFEEKKGPEIEKLLARRLDGRGKEKDARLEELHIALEPDDAERWGRIHELAVVRAPGMAGPHAILMDRGVDTVLYYDWYRPIKSLVPGGLYQFEIWYQDLDRIPPPLAHQVTSIGFNVLKEDEAGDGVGSAVELPRSTIGQWHKATVQVRMPLETDFRFRVRFNNVIGSFVYDRASLRYVSDRHQDALINFLEGAKE